MTTLTVNRKTVEIDADGDTPLLWVLRDSLGLTGTKFGCGIAQCGACTVHVNGAPQRSCVTTVASAAGKQITTIEGLDSPEGRAVREAWVKLDVPQCGYCQSGQIMSAVALLTKVRTPSVEDIDNALYGNICRCATYQRIRNAVLQAAKGLGG